MRKKLLTLITLLFIATALYNNVYAGEKGKGHETKLVRTTLGTDSVKADSLLQFAQSLIGTPYRTATSDPLIGFDCSGFVSYVFKSFNFDVPRSSYEFAGVGEKVRLEDAKPGDIILFTGTKSSNRRIGHIGIIYCTSGDEMQFIHSTSGKEHGVTITTMDATYKRRFVQIVRLIRQNDNVLAMHNVNASSAIN